MLVTMASPHQYVPLMLQPTLGGFYEKLNRRKLPDGLPVVSISGGVLDWQVGEG
jgi:hypothetical protein